MNAYISIGNSDNHLTQKRWSEFIASARGTVRSCAKAVHGEWYSAPDSAYQNACFAIEPDEHFKAELIQQLADLAAEYQQNSIAWTEGETGFITPTMPDPIIGRSHP